MRRRVADTLPDFPWDVLAPYGDLARRHPGGVVDLSVGTPVDPTPEVAQEATISLLPIAGTIASGPTSAPSVRASHREHAVRSSPLPAAVG